MRRATAAALAALLTAGLLPLGVTAAEARTGDPLTLEVTGTAVLTLPAGDGLQDATRVRIASTTGGDVDLLAVKGKKKIELADGAALVQTATGWQRTVKVPVRALPAGSWALVARRSDDHAVRARGIAPLRVGSGVPTQVTVVPSATTLYPWRDRVLDSVTVTTSAADETGTVLPVRGSVRIDAGALHRSRALTPTGARLSVVGLPLGPARLTTTVTGPGGDAVRTTALTLGPTGVGALRLSASSDTVQPVADGLLDSVVLTTSGEAVASSPAKVSGELTVSNRFGVLKSWKVADGAPRTFTWDGRVGGVIVPGTYTATLTLRGPEGVDRVRTQRLTVSKDHLPYRVRDLFGVADGNQQGLAVHDGLFYVATDVDTTSSRVDVVDGRGALVRTLGVLPIGHGAELAFSTTTGLLYAANGGPTSPTSIWAIDPASTDPVTAVKQTFDLSALGPNGMVGVDDAGGRLLVFSGVKDAYTLSAVGFDGTVQRTVPIAISGTPQGLDMVGTELWVYTSLRGRNRLARYAVTSDAVIAASTGTAAFDLMNPGEGEGFAAGADGSVYVGAHGPNRVGVLVPVADE